jgi:hypothetical protein
MIRRFRAPPATAPESEFRMQATLSPAAGGCGPFAAALAIGDDLPALTAVIEKPEAGEAFAHIVLSGGVNARWSKRETFTPTSDGPPPSTVITTTIAPHATVRVLPHTATGVLRINMAAACEGGQPQAVPSLTLIIIEGGYGSGS